MKRRYTPAVHGPHCLIFWRWLDIDRDSGEVYLRRLHLIRTPLFGLTLHRIYTEDQDAHEHDHPWSFISVVLRGCYRDRTRPGEPCPPLAQLLRRTRRIASPRSRRIA